MFYSIFCFVPVPKGAKKPQSESDLFNDLLERLKKRSLKSKKKAFSRRVQKLNILWEVLMILI